MDNLKIVDAHHHFWDPTKNYYPWLCDEQMIPFRYGDYSAIRKPFMPKDYFRVAEGHHIVKTISMEGEWDPEDPVGESLWMQSVAETFGFPHAHVAQAWLDADNIGEVLKAQSNVPLVKSVRHKPRASVSSDTVVKGIPGSMGDPKWRAGYGMLQEYGLHFDLQTPWWHLVEAAELAGDFPGTLLIINHTGLPADRSQSGLSGWRRAMNAIAKFENVVVKISGLCLPGKAWRVEDNKLIIKDTINMFGVDRCMFASNFPVDGVVADYNTIITGFKEAVANLPLQDQNKIFHDNAIRIYGL